jgi:hypothetical protein
VEIQKLRAKCQIANALNTRNGPSTTDIHELPLNSDVLIWHKGNTGQPGSWDGPYKLVAVNREDCILALPYGNTTFRSTSVKPFYIGDIEVITDGPEPEPVSELYGKAEGDTGMISPTVPAVPPKYSRGRPCKNPDFTVFLQDDNLYKDSRQVEVASLLEKGIFKVTPRSQVPKEVYIFNSRFINEIKNKGTEREFKKSRLVVQAYNNGKKYMVLIQSPTI